MIVVESRDFQKFATAVRGMEKEVKRNLTKTIRQKSEPIVREVRNAALQLPSDTDTKRKRLNKKQLAEGGRLGLRAGIAASVEVRVRQGASNPGVRIVVSRSMFEKQTGKSRSLPRYVEGLRRKPWRHPLWGNRNYWFTQKSRPFLLPTVLPHKNEIRSAILDEYENTFDDAMRRHGIPLS